MQEADEIKDRFARDEIPSRMNKRKRLLRLAFKLEFQGDFERVLLIIL